MSITTVNGEISKAQLGLTLAHEHLLIDLTGLVDKADPVLNPQFYEKVGQGNRYLIYSDPYAMIDNALIDDVDIAVNECKIAKESGICTIVDVTISDIARDPIKLKNISLRSGVNVVMGAGHYLDSALSTSVKLMTEKELSDDIIRDLSKGVDETDIKAGVIGEIGTSAVITDVEWKNIRAAGNASVVTNKGIHVHTSLWETNGLLISELLLKAGVKPHKICIDHIDVDLRFDYLLQLLDKGVTVEFDNFGKEFYIPKREQGLLKGRFAYDLERCKIIKQLCDRGYHKQIFLSNDICLKSMLCVYGGNGYGHITRNITVMLADAGVPINSIDRMLKDNISNFLE